MIIGIFLYVLILEGLKQVTSSIESILLCILITKDRHPHSLCRNEVFSIGQDRFRRFKRSCKQWCCEYQNRNKEPTRTYRQRCCKIYCSTQNWDISNDFCSNHCLKQGYAFKISIPCGKWGHKTDDTERDLKRIWERRFTHRPQPCNLHLCNLGHCRLALDAAARSYPFIGKGKTILIPFHYNSLGSDPFLTLFADLYL